MSNTSSLWGKYDKTDYEISVLCKQVKKQRKKRKQERQNRKKGRKCPK